VSVCASAKAGCQNSLSRLVFAVYTEDLLKRVKDNDGKLYLEVGGKLLFDGHASRVLPGFVPDIKVRLFAQMKDNIEVLLCLYCT
jgi:uncharacterized protein (UPF0371 family)